jgi:hypothetical protein
MATLDETNIFGLTPEQPEKKDDSLSRLGISESGYLNRLAQIQQMNLQGQTDMSEARSARGAEKKVLRDQYFSDLAEAAKDPTQEKRDTALESFFETPFMFQMGQYIPDPTGLPTDIAEAEYSGRKFKESREARGKGTEFYPGPLGFEDRPFYPDMTPEEAGLKLQQGLAMASIPPGIGGIAGIAQSMIGLPSKVLRSKSMDGQGGGGISNIQPQPTKDYAGFISSVEKTALGPQKFGSGQDLITYLESPKRSGISTKELEYIDFDQIRNNPDLTKEDVVKYIQDNRPNIYRVERVEDNPTYRADESDNPLTFLPLNEEATRIANLEQQAYFRDEYAQEIADHNEILTNNPTLQNSNFVLNSENINDPSVLDDLERYLKTEPEAYSGTNPTIVKYTKPDGTTGTGAYKSYASIMDFPDKFDELIKLAKDGATIEFPALTRNADDILEEASAMRVSPDYGDQIEVYESLGNSGTEYKIRGNDNTGYLVLVDGEPIRGRDFADTNTDIAHYDDLADARARVEAIAFDNSDIVEGADTFDTGSNPDQLLETAPMDVVTGEATLPTRFGYQYGDYRLPMGGADNYREFTLHIANPKTATRYDSTKGTKHFGGGDELLHYRVTDRIDVDGKKVLFVEEIQSDLHDTARSSKQSNTYEISLKEKEKIYDELEKFGFETNRMADSIVEYQSYVGELRFKGSTGSVVPVPPSGVRALGVALRKYGDDASLTAIPMLSKTQAEELVNKFGKDKIIEMADIIEPIRKSGTIPDFPYKGTDWVELAIKDIYKLAAEGDYDRVAFTNAPTQINRNQKRLNFITDIGLQRVPSIEEYQKSNQFKVDLDKNLQTRFDDEKNLVDSEYKQIYKNNYPNKEAWFADHPGVKNDIELVTKSRWADQNTEGDFILTKKGLGNLQEDDVYKSPEQLLEMIKQNPDKQIGAMPIRGKNIDDLLKELNMPLGDVKKQIMADIKAGNIPSSVDDGQIYELNIKEGSGKKYLDLYGSKIPQQAEKVAKKFDKGGKERKTFLNEIIYEPYKTNLEPNELYNYYDLIKQLDPNDPQIEQMNVVPLKHKATTIDITEEMRKAILTEGVNVMYKGGIVNKVKSMDKPIQGNRREM